MTILPPLFLFIVFVVVWLFENQTKRKSNLLCVEMLGVSMAGLKQKRPAAQTIPVLHLNYTQYALRSTDQKKRQSYPIDGRYISSLYPEDPVHPVENSCQMN